jgi:hypothetical protein
MRRSTDRILTTHVGALPAPLDVWAHPEVADDRLREAVAEVVAAQRDAGVDFINEGELTKGGTGSSTADRLGATSRRGARAPGEADVEQDGWTSRLLPRGENGTLFEQTADPARPGGADITAQGRRLGAAEPSIKGHAPSSARSRDEGLAG